MQPVPVILLLDTALAHVQVGVQADDGQFFHKTVELDQGPTSRQAPGAAEILIDQVSEVLASANHSMQDVALIVTTLGPGSFTGLRVGISTARGFGFALNCPVIGISSLQALALNIHTHPGRKLALIDARRGEVFMQIFDETNQPETAPVLLSRDEVANIVAPDMVLVGSGRAALEKAPAASDNDHVDLESLARFASNIDPADYPPEPIYVRAPDAKPQTKGRVARA